MKKKAHLRDISGIILLDKPQGFSSSQAVLKVRNLFRAQKAGHTGALDPLATGLLPICLGEAAKFSSFFLEGRKRYIAEGRLGIVTASADAEGEIIKTAEVGDAAARLEEVLKSFVGEIIQVPPIYSAIKVAGRELYKYARAGERVEIPSRHVTIYELKLLEKSEDRFKIEVYCSKGTYIRTLVADIGEALGVGAHVSFLRRTQVEGLPHDLISLELIEEIAADCRVSGDYRKLDKLLYPIDIMVARLPVLNLPVEMAKPLSHGVRQDLGHFSPEVSEDNLVQVRCEERFMGVCEVQGKLLVPKRLLDLSDFFK